MKRSKQNGSPSEPKLSSLKFIDPFIIKEGKRIWLINEFRGKSGVFVIRNQERIILVGMTNRCMHNSVFKFFRRKKFNNGQHGESFKTAFLPLEGRKLAEVQKALKKELKKLTFDDAYEKIEPFWRKGKDIPLELLNFKPPYSIGKDGERFCTFPFAFLKDRPGVYVIQEKPKEEENYVVVYVGMSERWLWQTMYGHYHPYTPDANGWEHHRVDFSKKLDTHDYLVALIEVPSVGKNQKQIWQQADELETFLIGQFLETVLNRDKKGTDKNETVPAETNSYHDWLTPTPDDDIPF